MNLSKLGVYFLKERLDAGLIGHIRRLGNNRNGLGHFGDDIDGEAKSLSVTTREDDAGCSSLSPCFRNRLV